MVDEDLKKLIESTAVETRRHFEVVAERLESKIDTVAEGVVAGNERINRFEVTMKAEFADVRSMIKFSHHELDRRVRVLEEVVSQLQARIERLESSTH